MVKCEYCENEYTEEEIFEDLDISCIDEHWYCSKFCYDKDFGESEEDD